MNLVMLRPIWLIDPCERGYTDDERFARSGPFNESDESGKTDGEWWSSTESSNMVVEQ